ncbi:MAG: hypothetical protein AAGI72_08670, partial [Pseudomonadota bacterium]
MAIQLVAFFLGTVSVLAEASIELAAEINPGVVQPGGLIDGQLTLSNTGSNASGLLSIEVDWPIGVGDLITTSFSPSCVGGVSRCDPGDRVIWSTDDLGSLPPGGSIQVGFTTLASNSIADGTDVSFDVELYEDGELVGTLSRSVRVQSQSLQLAIDPQVDPASPGSQFDYVVEYGNASGNTA